MAGVVSKQGHCLCRRVSVLSEADAYIEGGSRSSVSSMKGWFPIESKGWFPSDDDCGQVVDDRVKGVAPL